MAGREHDIVLFGATGFVGRITAAYLAEHADGLRVALAGRTMERLHSVRATLPTAAQDWPLIVADAGDVVSLRGLAESTGLVVTTVGPYRKYGMPLVRACAGAGTDYADLTGEVLFMRDSIAECDGVARRSRARIVHACGFDSIPSDIGVLAAFDTARQRDLGRLLGTTGALVDARGGFSGGTIDSMRVQLGEIAADGRLARAVSDPYALSPERDAEPSPGDGADLGRIVHDDTLGAWLSPWIMAGTNSRVVRRSNALLQWAYGRDFRYREVMSFGDGPSGLVKAAAMTAALGGVVAGMRFAPTRAVLDRMLPAPGEGPSDAARARGGFRLRVHAATQSGSTVVVEVALDRDPGYDGTALMLGEAALELVATRDAVTDRGGVLTPAVALGVPFIERLRRAGMAIAQQA